MNVHSHLRILAATSLLWSVAASAADPGSGTVSTESPVVSYSSGPFAVSNVSLNQDPNNPDCSLPVNPCDDFTLTVDVAPDYAATHPRDLVTVVSQWLVNNDAFYLYVLDGNGEYVNFSISANDPNALSFPAAAGTYTVRIVPSNAMGDFVTTSITLVPDPTAPASGTAPGYIALVPPAGLGDNTGGEMNVGFNPVTGRVMALGYVQTLRATFTENVQTQEDVTWEDVSEPNTTINTNDPILFTDALTGRTFVSQLQAGGPGQSIFYYTDDDGETWTLSPLTLDGGIDHQTIGAGPYAAAGSAGPATDYPNALYYCSQSVVAAFCIRSDDGGATFGLPVITKTAADCDGFLGAIHGHVKVAPDGTVYIPDRNCGGVQALLVSEDSGASFQVRRLPEYATAGENDSSLGIATDGTAYLCYLRSDGHVHVARTRDKGLTWENDRDVGYAAGVVYAVFPAAVAGDPDRAACAFLGTDTLGDFESTSFPGIWFPFIAMTYDGGQSWHTVNATPGDPVQGTGGIALAGTTAIYNRNLLDFNDATRDDHGRVLFGYDDGCLDDCLLPPYAPNQICLGSVCINSAAKTSLLRQSSGKTLLAAFDPVLPPVEPPAPPAAGGADSNARFGGSLGILVLLPLWGLAMWRRNVARRR